ncbi:MAG: LytR/AlgR family response regulator transcription factor [Sarcina sp.]
MVILIIEDDYMQRVGLKKIIEQHYLDVRVYAVDNIKEARNIANEKNIDLFLVDIKLPDGSGIEFVKELRTIEKYSLTGVVFISTQLVQIIDAFKNTHCYDFLVKPYNVNEIKAIINTFMKKQGILNVRDKNSIVITLDSGIDIKLYEEEIIFAEYSRRKCTIYTANDVIETKAITLTKLLQSCKVLLQSHKSYIVNIRCVKSIEKIYSKLWKINFSGITESALLSNSYKEEVLTKWKE